MLAYTWAQRLVAKPMGDTKPNGAASSASGGMVAGTASTAGAATIRQGGPTQQAAARAAPATPAAEGGGNVDDDGQGEFTVVPSRWRQSAARARGDGGGGTGAAASPSKSGIDGGGDSVDDAMGGQSADEPRGESGHEFRLDGAEGDGEEHAQPSHKVLWAELQDAREDLRFLRKKWDEEHWAVRSAVERVEAVEAAWQQERPEGSLSRRHVRAEQAVRKGDARVAQIIEDIHALDDDYNAKRQALEDRLMEERHKLRELRFKLDRVRAEVGAGRGQTSGDGGAAAEAQHPADRKAMLETVQCLQAEVGPTLLAMSEQLETAGAADDLKQQLQGIAAKLHAVHGTLQARAEAAAGCNGADRRYDIGDGDEASELPELTDYEWRQANAGWHHGWDSGVCGYDGWDYGGNNRTADDGWGWGYGRGQADHQGAPPAKKGKLDADEMQVQAYEDMRTPTDTHDDGDGQAAQQQPQLQQLQQQRAEAEAAAYKAQRAALAASIAEVKGAAQCKGVDLSDVDFETITPVQLEAIVAARLAPEPST